MNAKRSCVIYSVLYWIYYLINQEKLKDNPFIYSIFAFKYNP